jgi:hypothetical protein
MLDVMDRIWDDRPVTEERPPGARRRLDGDGQLKRDLKITRMRRRGLSLRAIATELGMSLSSVQAALARTTAQRMQRMDRAPRQKDNGPSEDW